MTQVMWGRGRPGTPERALFRFRRETFRFANRPKRNAFSENETKTLRVSPRKYLILLRREISDFAVLWDFKGLRVTGFCTCVGTGPKAPFGDESARDGALFEMRSHLDIFEART
jgi:hypothetical protein